MVVRVRWFAHALQISAVASHTVSCPHAVPTQRPWNTPDLFQSDGVAPQRWAGVTGWNPPPLPPNYRGKVEVGWRHHASHKCVCALADTHWVRARALNDASWGGHTSQEWPRGVQQCDGSRSDSVGRPPLCWGGGWTWTPTFPLCIHPAGMPPLDMAFLSTCCAAPRTTHHPTGVHSPTSYPDACSQCGPFHALRTWVCMACPQPVAFCFAVPWPGAPPSHDLR